MDQGGADALTYLINLGAVGVVLVLWLLGWIVSKRELDRERERAEQWRSMYTAEAEAHEVTRRAAQQDRERADAGTEAARTAATLLQYLGHMPAGGGPG